MMGVFLRDQLKINFEQSKCLDQIVSDYHDCVTKLRELQVRNAQLDKESSELRLENETLVQAVEVAKRSTASSAELEEARLHATQLQAELVVAYKEKSDAADTRAQALEQLELVRELNSKQSIELQQASKERHTLLDEIKVLRSEVSRLSQARDLTVKELENRKKELQTMQDRYASLEIENQDLTHHILVMKEEEIERMNATSKMCEDLVADARNRANEIVATARAAIAKEAAARGATAGNAPVLDAGGLALENSIKQLNLAAGVVGGSLLPTTVSKCVPAVHAGGCYSLSMDATGSQLASCGADRVVRLWDVTRSSVRFELRGAVEGVNDVAFTLDGKHILGVDSKVHIWNTRTGRLINTALTGHAGKVTGVVVSPSDPDMVVTTSADRSIKLWTLARGQCTRTFRFPSTARRVAMMSDSGLIVSGHVDGRLRFWDARSSRAEALKEVELHARQEVFSVTSALAGGTVVTCSRDSSVHKVDTRTFEVQRRLSAPELRMERSPWVVPALSPSISHVAVGSEDGCIYLWDVDSENKEKADGGGTSPSSHEYMRVLKQPKNAKKEQQEAAVVGCCWSPAGSPLVSTDRLGGVTFWSSE